MMAATAFAAEPWREASIRAAERMTDRVEILDEALHEAYEHHSSPAFLKTIEDFHHIEKVLAYLRELLPVAPHGQVCREVAHLVEDLNAIRLDLIALKVQETKVIQAWNDMAAVYNQEMYPHFKTCHRSWTGTEFTIRDLN